MSEKISRTSTAAFTKSFAQPEQPWGTHRNRSTNWTIIAKIAKKKSSAVPIASRTFMSAVLVANGNHGFAPSSRPDGNLSTHEPQNHVLWEKNAISGLKQFQDFYDKNSSTHQTHVRFFGKCQKKGQHQAHQQKKTHFTSKKRTDFRKKRTKTLFLHTTQNSNYEKK